MAKKILVTGVAGSGKSSLQRMFNKKGYQTSDIDDGFAEWRNKDSGKTEEYKPDDPEWLNQVYWALRTDALRDRLKDAADQSIAIFGSTNDLHNYADLFDTVYLLEYPDDEAVKERLASRPRGFGRVDHERDSVLSYYKQYQDQMKSIGAVCIGYEVPLDQKALFIEEGLLGE